MQTLNLKKRLSALFLGIGIGLATTACWADEAALTGAWSANQRSTGGLGEEIRCQGNGFCVLDFGVVLDTRYESSANEIVLTRIGDFSAEGSASAPNQMRIRLGKDPFLGTDLSGLVLNRSSFAPKGKNSFEGEWVTTLALTADQQREAPGMPGPPLFLQLAPDGQARLSVVMKRSPWRLKTTEDGRHVITSAKAPGEVFELRLVADELQTIDSRGQIRTFNRLKF